MKSMKLTIAVIATVGLLAGVTDWTDAPSAASTAAPYTNLDAEGEPLKTAFNDAVGKIRVVAYVAPTCGGCLKGAKLLQEEVLDRVASDDLSVLVVWVPKNSARERNVDKVTELVTDERAQQFWDVHAERLHVRIVAAAMITALAPSVRKVIGSPPNVHPSTTATTGFANAKLDTFAAVLTRSRKTYAGKATIAPNTVKYASDATDRSEMASGRTRETSSVRSPASRRNAPPEIICMEAARSGDAGSGACRE